MEKLIKQILELSQKIARVTKENETMYLAQDIEQLCETLKDKSK